LVDLDPLGGGADLLLGAERAAGWRWDRLRAARGQIGELRGQVPVVTGVTVVSMARDDPTAVTRDAVASVVASLSRSSDLVVMDVGRSLDAGGREALRAADRTVLVCAADVRAVASARMTLAAAEVAGAGVVVRLRKGGSVRVGDVATAVGLPLWGTLPVDAAQSAAAERGVPPDRAAAAPRGVPPDWAAGRAWLRACARVLAELGVAVTPDPGWGRS
jgi:MinD-like ATPase involved in chromosome partitioning or flagellar assembly